ncbi:exostosin domain-containing protein [Paractinoplanes rishiriensis]|uniref:exostosin domain-containing protein n=1 Tax=Paractinoplanes rishiriensis TaxID=1050105 RepID=UPI0019453324|nr:exostosin family protein [Actinoplanes rishiriensis]
MRVYIYKSGSLPHVMLNPIAKALLHDDPRFQEGRWLYELTTDPDAADILTPPYDVAYFEDRIDELQSALPHYSGAAERHVFFDSRDDPAIPDFLAESVFLKASLHSAAAGPRRVCLPYTERIDNFFPRFAEEPELRYDVSFVGEVSQTREPIIAAVRASGLRARVVDRRQNYYGPPQLRGADRLETAGTPQRTKWRKEFLDITMRSRFVLAVPGYGLNSFRFYEALSLGVPPLLIDENAALPFPQHINYDEFCLRLSLSDDNLSESIKGAVEAVGDERWQQMRKLARHTFDTYLSTFNLLFLLYQAIRESTAVGPLK